MTLISLMNADKTKKSASFCVNLRPNSWERLNGYDQTGLPSLCFWWCGGGKAIDGDGFARGVDGRL